jgi:alanyl-tRNA synthetase
VGTIFGQTGNGSAFITFSTATAREKFKLDANVVLREQFRFAGGSGGGNQKLASGGSSDPRGGELAAKALPDIVKKLTNE